MTIVHLGRVLASPANSQERTYTDNISAHGVRVFSKERWQPGADIRVTSIKDHISIDGKVVYCQQLADAHFCVGVNFQIQRVTWSTYLRFDGVT
jgi:PilZ domain-containing protein